MTMADRLAADLIRVCARARARARTHRSWHLLAAGQPSIAVKAKSFHQWGIGSLFSPTSVCWGPAHKRLLLGQHCQELSKIIESTMTPRGRWLGKPFFPFWCSHNHTGMDFSALLKVKAATHSLWPFTCRLSSMSPALMQHGSSPVLNLAQALATRDGICQKLSCLLLCHIRQ